MTANHKNWLLSHYGLYFIYFCCFTNWASMCLCPQRDTAKRRDVGMRNTEGQDLFHLQGKKYMLHGMLQLYRGSWIHRALTEDLGSVNCCANPLAATIRHMVGYSVTIVFNDMKCPQDTAMPLCCLLCRMPGSEAVVLAQLQEKRLMWKDANKSYLQDGTKYCTVSVKKRKHIVYYNNP